MNRLPREPEAFGEAIVREMLRLQPSRSIEFSGPLDVVADGHHLDLSHLYRMVWQQPKHGQHIVTKYLDRLEAMRSAESTEVPFAVARTRIMPRIQPLSIFQKLDREQVAHLPFVNDTVIVYVLDLPTATVSLTVDQLLGWGIDAHQADVLARRNLIRHRDTPRIVHSPEGGRAALFCRRDGYDASRLLADDLHERLSPILGGDFLVSLPSRDSFLAISTKVSDFVIRMRKRTQNEHRRLPYPISPEFFHVSRDGVSGTVREAA